MDNPNYAYPDIDPGFHISIPKNQSNVPLAFQSSNDVEVDFPAHNYQMSSSTYFPDVNLIAAEENGGIITPTHHEATTEDSSVLAPTGPEPSGCMFSSNSIDEADPVAFPNPGASTLMSTEESDQFCSKFPAEASDNGPPLPFSPTLPAVQAETFVNPLSQHQGFENEFQSRDLPGHNGMFPSDHPNLLEGYITTNSQQPQSNEDVSGFSDTTSFGDSNQVPENLYPPPSTEDKQFLLHPSYSDSSVNATNSFLDANFTTQCDPEVALPHVTASSHLQYEGSFAPACVPQMSPVVESQPSRPITAESSSEVGAIIDKSYCQYSQNVEDCDSVHQLESIASCEKNDETLCAGLDLYTQEKKSTEISKDSNGPHLSNKLVLSDTTPSVVEDLPAVSSNPGITRNEIEPGSEIVPTLGDIENKKESEKETISQSRSQDLESEESAKSDGEVQAEDISLKGQEDPELIKNKTDDPRCNEVSEIKEVASIDSSEQKDKKPLSPMITVMNDSFGDGQDISNSQDGISGTLQTNEAEMNVRVTRTKTGKVRKTQRLVDQLRSEMTDESSLDSISMEDWEYEEGAELAPCKIDPSIPVPERVLQVTEDELNFYHHVFANGIESVLKMRLHCTICAKHIGAAPNYIHLGNRHKVLRVLICNKCRAFYGVGKFPRDSDGSELYCRWCGQGGQVICCSNCPNIFCEPCITKNFGGSELNLIAALDDWACFICNYQELWRHRAICWALLTYTMQMKKEALSSNNPKTLRELEEDRSKCCPQLKHKRRKQPKASKAASPQGSNLNDVDNLHFGHFLSDGSTFENILTQSLQEDPAGEEDEYLDLSQFVQPVLQEEQEQCGRQVKQVRQLNLSRNQPPALVPVRPVRQIGPRAPSVQHRLRGPQPMPVTPIGPRIVIRQGNMMQPGLVPFNSQPNVISAPDLTRSGVTVRSVAVSAASTLSSRPLVRNSANLLNNVDGVRSMDQIHSLNQVPWLRDGIDNVRAVGFALNKRIRELEARFHSIKNKQDIEKVITLGKKLDRLSQKTERRFKQITSCIRDASRQWYTQRVGNIITKSPNSHPFNFYRDCPSDWDDDAELIKPLEKIMIPVNAASLQSVVSRSTVRPGQTIRPVKPVANTVLIPSIVRGSPIISVPRAATPVQVQPHGRLTSPTQGPVTFTRQNVFSNNQITFQRVRLPGPKSSAIRYKQIPTRGPASGVVLKPNNLEGVGAFLNMRNGPNTISVSLAAPLKRKRNTSDSDSSDVVLCPTIPELLAMHNIKPCKVIVERADDFIVSFLERQEQQRRQNTDCCNDRLSDFDTECFDITVPEVETVVVPSNISADDCSSFPDVEAVCVPCDSSQDNDVLNVLEGTVDDPISDDFQTPAREESDNDDDIEIIHEVNQSS